MPPGQEIDCLRQYTKPLMLIKIEPFTVLHKMTQFNMNSVVISMFWYIIMLKVLTENIY